MDQRLVLAGLGLRLVSDCAAAGRVLTHYLNPARRQKGGDARPELLCTSRLVPAWELNPENEAESGLVCVDGPFRLSAKGGVRGRMDAHCHQLELDIVREFLLWSDYYRWLPYSTMLRLWLSVELPRREGLVMHGASVQTREGALLFIGESGAGKSTVCDLSGERLLFNDEISLLRREQGCWRVWPSPFFSRPERTRRAWEPQALTGLCLLEKATHDRLIPLSPTEALPTLMGCILNFLNDATSAARLLDLSLDLLQALPVYRLQFRKTPDFWRLLESDGP